MDAEGIDPPSTPVEFQQHEPFLFGRGLEIKRGGFHQHRRPLCGWRPGGQLPLGHLRGPIWAGSAARTRPNAWPAASKLKAVDSHPDITRHLALYDAIMNRENGSPWQEANLALQQLMTDYCPSGPHARALRDLLNAGIKYMGDLRQKDLKEMGASCSHTLLRGSGDFGPHRSGRGGHVRGPGASGNPPAARALRLHLHQPLMGDKFINVYLKNGKPVTPGASAVMI
jgi:hypothetical protein